MRREELYMGAGWRGHAEGDGQRGGSSARCLAADQRVSLIEQSLGGSMLRVANLIPHAYSEPGPRCGLFREIYRRYSTEDLDQEQFIFSGALFKESREHVLVWTRVHSQDLHRR